MKLYVVINNNHDEEGQYKEWVDGIYSTKNKALVNVRKCELELLKSLQEAYQEGYPLETIQKWHKNILIDTPIKIRVYVLDKPDG